MTSLEPTPMDRAQIRHLEDVREIWRQCAFLMKQQELYRGAMGWKKVGAYEYLTSYWTDPVTGKKQMNSLGRRSPETEKKKADFDRGRTEVDNAVAEWTRDLLPLIRVGRALRIGRLEPIACDVLRVLATNDLLGPKLMVIGSAALSLYEAYACAMLPMVIKPQGDLDLLSSAESRQEALEELLPVIQRADKSFTLHGPTPSIKNSHGFHVDLHTQQSVRRAIDRLSEASEEQISVLHCLLDLAPVSATTVARDGSPVEIIGMDPRAFALTKHALATLGGLDGTAARMAKDQAYAVGRLVMKFGAKPFEEEHLEVFPDFAEQIDVGDPEATAVVRKFFGP